MKDINTFYRSSKFETIGLFEDRKKLEAQPSTVADNEITRKIINDAGMEVFDYLNEHIDLSKIDNLLLSSADPLFVNEHISGDDIRFCVEIKPINNNENINNHLNSINKVLCDAGIFIGCANTYGAKKARMFSRFGNVFGKLFYGVDFLLNRFLPRISFFSKLYFKTTKGKFYSMSLAESLGRLVYNGFEIVEFKHIGDKMYFVAMKTGDQKSNKTPTFGPLVRLKRVGKNGKIIDVFKFRSMHPYSEYIQDFVIALNGYNEVGKPANDFRVTNWGKMIRKLWLDECPQLINVLKGNMKLVGVRPLSKVRFGEFPEDMQKERVNYKPGCFPPYVALNMPDSVNNIEAERVYLKDLAAHPLTTDIKYLAMSVYNILSNKIRSS